MAAVQPAPIADSTESTPDAADSTPAATDSTPAAAADSTPAATDSTPAATDSTPAATDRAPPATDSTPAADAETDLAATSPPTKPETRPGVILLRSWLSRIVRVKLTDGRVVAGTLRCIDRNRNLVLGSANERFGDGPPQTIGHVMVPGKHIVQLWVENLDSV